MLPRLQAEEQLAAIEAAAIGFGTVSQQDRAKALSRLQRAIDPDRQVAKASPMALQHMGIAIIEVPTSRGDTDV